MSKKQWDSNVITPGTPFMERLGEYLRCFIHRKLTFAPSRVKPDKATSRPSQTSSIVVASPIF